MKKAYLSIGYQSRQLLNAEIETIRQTLAKFEIDLFIFVDVYHFSADQEKQMMQQAFAAIESADFLIAEVSEKAIGVGIEIGYAAASHKPIIYIRNADAAHSTTSAGCARDRVIYQNEEDLRKKLAAVLSNLTR